MKRLFLASFVALSLFTLGACKSAEPYAAKVNGVTLTKADLDRELNAIRDNKDYAKLIEQAGTNVNGTGNDTLDATFVARVLSRRILFELVHQEVLKRRLKLTAEAKSAAKQQVVSSIGDEKTLDKFPKDYVDELERTNAEVYVLQNALADTSDKNLEKYYEAHKADFVSVCAAHILVATKAEADSIEKQLKAAKDKAATFAELAKTKSKDTGSGANGGDLGCAAPSGYVEEFKQATLTQKVGVIGDPVQTQYGYHIIRVDKRDEAKPFAEVKEEVRNALTQDSSVPFTEFLKSASAKAKVEVNPRYGTYESSGDLAQVVPPKAPSNSK